MTPMKHIICLYEHSGLSAADWARAGYAVYCYDILHKERAEKADGGGILIQMPRDACNEEENDALISRHQGKTQLILGFPPCTDLAVSGARHFAAKYKANKYFQRDALALVLLVEKRAERLNAPYCIENPVSVISIMWRKPDLVFNPSDFGGYLPEDDVHPLYPEYINPRDAYPKKTCYWIGGGFKLPKKSPVPLPGGYSKQHTQLGGKSEKTKRIRSMSPRGVARAIFEANKGTEK